MATIQISNLTKAYTQSSKDATSVFSGLTLNIGKTESLAVLGMPGSGKSTLIRLLADLDKPDSGRILIDDQEPRQIRLTNGFGMVFQTPVLYDWRTVRRNICMPMEIVDMEKQQRTARIDELLGLMGMEDYGKKYPFELSADLQQRVGIARALTLDPEMLYMDDPFSGYDAELRKQMNVWLKSLIQSLDKQIIFTTTELEEAVFLGDSVLVLSPDKDTKNDIITFESDNTAYQWGDKEHQSRIKRVQRITKTAI